MSDKSNNDQDSRTKPIPSSSPKGSASFSPPGGPDLGGDTADFAAVEEKHWYTSLPSRLDMAGFHIRDV